MSWVGSEDGKYFKTGRQIRCERQLKTVILLLINKIQKTLSEAYCRITRGLEVGYENDKEPGKKNPKD